MKRSPRPDFTSYDHEPCRRCLQLGIWIDRAIQPVVGLTGDGDHILGCGHHQESGDRSSRTRISTPLSDS